MAGLRIQPQPGNFFQGLAQRDEDFSFSAACRKARGLGKLSGLRWHKRENSGIGYRSYGTCRRASAFQSKEAPFFSVDASAQAQRSRLQTGYLSGRRLPQFPLRDGRPLPQRSLGVRSAVSSSNQQVHSYGSDGGEQWKTEARRLFAAQERTAGGQAGTVAAEAQEPMSPRAEGRGDAGAIGWIKAGFRKLKENVAHLRRSYKDMLSLNNWIIEDYKTLVAAVNAFEPEMEQLTDEKLKAKTVDFRRRLQVGETLEDIQAEAFAVVREAAKRTLGMRHFDVQIIGGAILHDGAIAEMKTGEGKTLVSTLAAYLNSLTGKGVHVVTVNDYLAKRDAEWMGRIHRSLGLTVGLIQSDLSPEERRAAYSCDITYTNNSELGFDFLRDHTCMEPEDLVLRWPDPFHFAIVDEVDSVLVDEGRNPLLISGLSGKGETKYPVAAEVAAKLSGVDREVLLHDGTVSHFPKDYKADQKDKSVELTDFGVERAEFFLQDYLDKEAGEDLWFGADSWARYVVMAIKAREFYIRDRDYIVRDGNVEIVDEFTGRIMANRRWSDGQHQAVEAKEGLPVKPNMVTVAQITYQSFFQFYSKIAGMTGTAKTEEVEFLKIYKVPVVVVPTNEPNIRKDLPLQVFISPQGKWERVADEVYEMHLTGRPVLVGTTSVEQSEDLSEILRRSKIQHNLLNARPQYAAREAEIVAQAGKLNAVTISTNMAGRGTDIILGGNPEMLARQLLEHYILPVIAAEDSSSDDDDDQVGGGGGKRPSRMQLDHGGAFQPAERSEFWPLLERAKKAARFVGSGESPRLRADEGRRLLAVAMEMANDDAAAAAAGALKEEEAARAALVSMPGGADKDDDVDDGRPGAELLEFVPRIARAYKALLQECKRHCHREGAYVKRLGGLHVIGTALHESRRVDNQLRGRAGRQGDPGSTRFMISAHDDLLSRFGSQVTSVTAMLNSLSVYKEYPDFPIESRMVEEMFGQLQRKVEQYYFGLRKQLVEFEEVFEVQRTYFYELRQEMLMEDPDRRRERLFRWMQAVVDEIVLRHVDPAKAPAQWRLGAILQEFRDLAREHDGGVDNNDSHTEDLLLLPDVTAEHLARSLLHVSSSAKTIVGGPSSSSSSSSSFPDHHLAFLPAIPSSSSSAAPSIRSTTALLRRWHDITVDDACLEGRYREQVLFLRRYLGEVMIGAYQDRVSTLTAAQQRMMRSAEKHIALQVLDQQWQLHLLNMQRLRSAVNVRSFGQMNPLEEYRIDGCRIFIGMLSISRRRVVSELLPIPQQYVIMARERKQESDLVSKS